MTRKTYDRIKRWSKRHDGAYYTNQTTTEFLTWEETTALTWGEVVEWFNAARPANIVAVKRPA